MRCVPSADVAQLVPSSPDNEVATGSVARIGMSLERVGRLFSS